MMRMQALMARLGLQVNTAKTRIARLPEESFNFLGYTVGGFYGKAGRRYIGTCPSRKAVRALLQRIRERTAGPIAAPAPPLTSGPRRFSSSSTGRSRSRMQSGEPAMRAASAAALTNIGVLPPSDAQRSHFHPTISYHFSAPSKGEIFQCYRQNSKSRKTGVASPCVSAS